MSSARPKPQAPKHPERDEPGYIPSGIELWPIDPRFREHPHEVLRELRERCPVHRDPAFDRVVLTRFADCDRILRDARFGVDPRKSLPDDPVRQFVREGEEPSMLFLDDPDHARLRKLVSPAFTPRRAESWRPLAREIASALLDAVDRAGEPEFDLIGALAAPLPAIAIARILGVDSAEQARFKTWSEASSAAFFNPLAGEEEKRLAAEAEDRLDACFRAEIARRREQPSDDLIGVLVAAEQDGDRLSEREVGTMCALLLIAGNVTTTDLIGNGVRVLLQHPHELERLRREPERIACVVEEMLRFDPPVTVTGRIAPRDHEIDGVPIRARESVTAILSAANRDPVANPDPDRFDTERFAGDRAEARHLSFGGGAHLCLGAHLARIEAQEAVGALVARYPRLRPASRPETWKQVPGFRGLAEYWVRVD
jgi:cytochrome P450